MAARLNKRHSDEVRARIQASLLVNRLHDCAMGDLELTAIQVKAIEALLDRSVPKLSQIQHVGGEDDEPIKLVFGWMSGES
jgi:hypothetical protein